jgi:hypothetical protein
MDIIAAQVRSVKGDIIHIYDGCLFWSQRLKVGDVGSLCENPRVSHVSYDLVLLHAVDKELTPVNSTKAR